MATISGICPTMGNNVGNKIMRNILQFLQIDVALTDKKFQSTKNYYWVFPNKCLVADIVIFSKDIS